MARPSKTNRLKAKFKAKKRKERLRKNKQLVKRRAGGRLVKKINRKDRVR
ncbi:MAG: hypothetical protein AB8H79_19775 [Myxococcota bacterium]